MKKRGIRRLFSVLLALVVIVGTINLPMNVKAAKADGSQQIGASSAYWEVIDGVLYITGSGDLPDYSAPSNQPWYSGRESITSIIIHDEITRLGNANFEGLHNVTSISVPDSVTSIGQYCFYYTDIESAVINGSNITVDLFAFAGCEKLKNVSFSGEVHYYADGIFTNCMNLETVTFGSINRLGQADFYGCPKLEKIVINNIPDGFTISERVFDFGVDVHVDAIPANLHIVIPDGKSIADLGISNATLMSALCVKVVTQSQYDALKVGDGKITQRNHDFGENTVFTKIDENTHQWTCSTCGGIAQGNHDFSKYVSNGNGTHKVVCADCGTVQSGHDKDACSGGTATCKARAVCTKCGEAYGSLAAHKGGTATCKAKAKCSVCGKEYGSLAAHTYATKWGTDATNHWHTCTVCGAKKDSAVHADSNKDGKCNTCSYNMHSHSGTKVAQEDATCTSYGVKAYYKCSCGKYYTDSACTKEITDLAAWKSGDGRIEKKAHTLKTTTTKATLKANGKKETKCSVCGKVTKTETIYAAKTIKLSATKYTYDGKAKKPSVTIKDSKGNAIASTNYTVTYPSGRKNVGKYTVKVTFKGNYSGSKNLTFTINPPKTSISKVTAGKKAFTVKWAKKTTQVTGYEIQYSTSSTFAKGNKTVKITSAKTVSKTISKLTGGKKYYVRIRTYKTVGKTPYYSDWSAKKSVTTKK